MAVCPCGKRKTRYRRDICYACRKALTPPTPLRISRYDKALSWLRTAPRTTRQLAALIGVTPGHASVIVLTLRRRNLACPVGALRRGHENRYRAR